MTYYIDEIQPGLAESFTKTVTEKEIALFGEVSGDKNPVHFDQAFAETTIFKGRVAHGMLSGSFISTVIGTKLPGPGSIFISLNMKFVAPVHIGDVVVTTCTVREVQAKRRILLDCVCKVGDKDVITGEAVAMPPMRPRSA